MKVRAIGVALALGLVACAAAVPTAAVAKPGYYVSPGYRVEAAELHGSNGYKIYLQALTSSERWVYLDASKALPHDADYFVNYSRTSKRSDQTGFHLHLGSEGRIDLRFVPHKREEVAPIEGCTGAPSVVETGAFVGTFDFRGRRGFTRVETRRVHGYVAINHREICRRQKASKNDDGISVSIGTSTAPEEDEVQLIAGGRSGSPFFQAIGLTDDEDAFTTLSASMSRRSRGISMYSAATISGLDTRSNSFALPDPLDPHHATSVEPPAPFSGSASFELSSARDAEFSGDLAVELPGFGRVRLTGNDIHAGLCEGTACTDTLPKALRPEGTHVFGESGS